MTGDGAFDPLHQADAVATAPVRQIDAPAPKGQKQLQHSESKEMVVTASRRRPDQSRAPRHGSAEGDTAPWGRHALGAAVEPGG